MSAVIIGRKELFSFADRYSSRRLRDYSSLADGEVLCQLFNLVFPLHRIPAAPQQTHSPTQRAHLHWEALYRRAARVAIPLTFFNPAALEQNSVEVGFSVLVVFFFLHHLSKQTDFSAEFAMDVREAVSSYLQSTSCIATLLLGQALEWSDIPTHLAEMIRAEPVFQRSESDVKEDEESAATEYRRRYIKVSPALRRFGSVPRSRSANRRPLTAPVKTTNEDDFMSAIRPQKDGPSMPLKGSNTGRQSTSTSRASSSDGDATKSSLRGSSKGGMEGSRSSSEAESQGSTAGPARNSTPVSSLSTSSASAAVNLDYHEVSLTSSRQGVFSIASEGQQPLQRGTEASNVIATPSARREALLEARLTAREAECEQLKMRIAQLLSLLTSSKAKEGSASRNTSFSTTAPSQSDDGLLRQYGQRVKELEEPLKHQQQQQKQALYGNCTGKSLENFSGAHSSTGEGKLDEEIRELTADVVDSETGEVIDAHEKANLLHCLLLEQLPDSLHNRELMEQWLWSIVAVHHTLEARLITAVGIINSLRQECLSMTMSAPRVTSVSTMGSSTAELAALRESFYEELDQLHSLEHKTREAVADGQAEVQAVTQRAIHREHLWQKLCAAVYDAEQASFSITNCTTADEVEAKLMERDAHYTAVESLTARLIEEAKQYSRQKEMREKTPTSAAEGQKCSGATGSCASLRALAAHLQRERVELLHELTELREALVAQQRKPKHQSCTNAAANVPLTQSRLSSAQSLTTEMEPLEVKMMASPAVPEQVNPSRATFSTPLSLKQSGTYHLGPELSHLLRGDAAAVY